jgi:molybdate transport system substrate-binding protein
MMFVLAMLLGSAAFVSAAPSVNLTVSAAISLSESLQTIRDLYRRQAPDVSLTLNLGASGVLQQQIEQGAPADIFISASPREMNALAAAGLLLAGSRANLLRNTLVLVCPASFKGISGFGDLTQARVKRIAMANPESVPAGMYAEQSLKYFHLYARLKPKLILAQDVRQALAYVETGDVDAGIVYLTEARLSNKVKVAAEAPKASHTPIVYPVAIIMGSPHVDAAQKFLEFLKSSEARQVFEREGFRE